jgi:hypothetical protein
MAKLKNAFSGTRKAVGNTAGYVGRAANRTGARLSGYKSLENKYKSAMNRAGANKARVEGTLKGRKEGESLNEYRSRLAANRKEGFKKFRAGIKDRISNTAKAIRNKFRAGLGKAKRFGQNVLAGKLGRSNEEREANWAAHYGKKANTAEGSLERARLADAEASVREATRNQIIGYLAESIMGARASAAGTLAVLRAYMKMPHLGEGASLAALEALIKEIESAGGKLSKEMKERLEKLGLALDEEVGKVSDAVMSALKGLAMSESAKQALAKGFRDLREAMVKDRGVVAAVKAALSSVPGLAASAAASLGAAFVAMKSLDMDLRKAICGSVGACGAKEPNAIFVGTSNTSSRKGGLTRYNPPVEPMNRRSSRRNNRR